MTKSRLETFSDGVLAIIITIMVLEFKVPHGDDLHSLKPLVPVFISYVLSFINIGIYWNNHHHMLHAAHKINGNILWTNSHLLFWLSLIPFVTSWMGENNFTTMPVALYGFVSLMAGLAYYWLARSLKSLHGKESAFSNALGRNIKGIASIIFYMMGIGLSFVQPMLGFSMYLIVAVIWVIPDVRFERNAETNM